MGEPTWGKMAKFTQNSRHGERRRGEESPDQASREIVEMKLKRKAENEARERRGSGKKERGAGG